MVFRFEADRGQQWDMHVVVAYDADTNTVHAIHPRMRVTNGKLQFGQDKRHELWIKKPECDCHWHNSGCDRSSCLDWWKEHAQYPGTFVEASPGTQYTVTHYKYPRRPWVVTTWARQRDVEDSYDPIMPALDAAARDAAVAVMGAMRKQRLVPRDVAQYLARHVWAMRGQYNASFICYHPHRALQSQLWQGSCS